MKSLTLILTFFIMTAVNAQDQLPYYEIPDSPESFKPGDIMSRMVDGLGFRYYWASDSLTEADLNFKPSEEARTSRQTIEHICGLSIFVLRTVKPDFKVDGDYKTKSYEEIRALTLNYFKVISDEFRGKTGDELASMEIVLGSGDRKRTMPFWNLINGPIEDAVYHTGQLVSFRRASGNPINSNISVLSGKVRK